MVLFTLPSTGLEVPGWFGKLPGMGDFGQRRLSPRFRAVWDNWLQTGLQTLRAERENWVAEYLHAPIWYFALGKDIMSPSPWIGVLIPSVDSVGRYFPLTLAIELDEGNEASVDRQMASIHQWWQRSAKAALAALDSNMGAEQFDGYLQKQFGAAAEPEMIHTTMRALPAAGLSSWFVDAGTSPNVVETIPHLPGTARFTALFGSVNLAVDGQNSQ